MVANVLLIARAHYREHARHIREWRSKQV